MDAAAWLPAVIAVVAGLFAISSAVLTIALGSGVQREHWLRDKRLEAYGELLAAYDENVMALIRLVNLQEVVKPPHTPRPVAGNPEEMEIADPGGRRREAWRRFDALAERALQATRDQSLAHLRYRAAFATAKLLAGDEAIIAALLEAEARGEPEVDDLTSGNFDPTAASIRLAYKDFEEAAAAQLVGDRRSWATTLRLIRRGHS